MESRRKTCNTNESDIGLIVKVIGEENLISKGRWEKLLRRLELEVRKE